MGEYAYYNGSSIKIGTCESMYYLRADQAHLVEAREGNVDPIADAAAIRFRFPFPDEDGIEPGAFGDYDRGLSILGVKTPDGVDHYGVTFKTEDGYQVRLPCPRSAAEGVLSVTSDGSDHAYRVHGSPESGDVDLVQQRWWDGRLVIVCRCTCGALYRMPELEDAQPVLDSLDLMAKREAHSRNELGAVQLRTIADRIVAGYELPGLEMASEAADL